MGTLTTYDFGTFVKSGKDYDRAIIEENANFVGWRPECKKPGCLEVARQISESLFSWWTDVPWLNLTVAGRMIAKLAEERGSERITSAPLRPAAGGWARLAADIKFVPFEYLSYQQWCVLHEGFRFRDVTEYTGEAKWGSYMEDPLPGAQLASLEPLWVSSEALDRVESGVLPALSDAVPPLLIFHADKGRQRVNRELIKRKWEEVVLAFL